MDYQRIYSEFIADRKVKPKPQSYTESHHIVPRSLGGGDELDNLIDLTAEDHFFAHLLLAKAHGGRQWYALFVMMKGRGRKDTGYLKRARRHYATARKEFIARHSVHMAGQRLGQRHTEETKSKIAASNRKPKNETAIANMRKALTGRKLSPEHRAKSAITLRDASRFAGKTHGADTKQRMSEVNQARKLYTARFGGDGRSATIKKMREVGIDI